ncbi:MAG: hypothetical protein ACREL5_09630 [Gemmatimonadales bacterium]
MLRSTAIRVAALSLVAVFPMLAQGTSLPNGWMMRFDPPRGGRPAPPPTQASMVTMGSGFHFRSGPMGAAIYYNPKDMGSGVYAATATFHAAHSMQHESYGIFIGGTNLQDSTQNYLYLVIRPMDGHFAIGHRDSNGRPTYLAAMATDSNPAINKDAASDGSSTNTVTIHVARDTVHFLVNGKLVKAIAKSDMGGATTDGQAGIRINHNLDVHVDGWSVK